MKKLKMIDGFEPCLFGEAAQRESWLLTHQQGRIKEIKTFSILNQVMRICRLYSK